MNECSCPARPDPHYVGICGGRVGGYRAEVDEIRGAIARIELEATTFGDLLALGQLVELEQTVRDAIARTGASLRLAGASYGQLGDVLGVSKQAARKRFP